MKVDESRWISDMDRAGAAIAGRPYVVKYGRRDHIDALARGGKLQISPALSYAHDESSERADYETERRFELSEFHSSRQTHTRMPSQSNPAATIRVKHVGGMTSVHSYPDYWMYCTSSKLSRDLMWRFGGSGCVIVGFEALRRLLTQIGTSLAKKKFVLKDDDYGDPDEVFEFPPKLMLAGPVAYFETPKAASIGSVEWDAWRRTIHDTENLRDLFIKTIDYSHQYEFRFAWPFFDWQDVSTKYQRWAFMVEDIDSGERHPIIEHLDPHSEDWMYTVRLPKVNVDVDPPKAAIRLTV